MNRPKIQIRHGQFTDLLGPPQTYDDITFAAAQVQLNGSIFDLTHPLESWIDQHHVPRETKALVLAAENAVWVRGRVQQLFKIPNTTEEDRGEKTFFLGELIAILQGEAGQSLGIPFLCTDTYGRSGLMFSSEDPPPQELQQRIGNAFWSLLLSDPRNLEDYRDSILHLGTGAWLDFGVQDGDPFLEERPS